ncbi:MAG: tetratricopeptide repeat protein [Planctomycetota bacterium]
MATSSQRISFAQLVLDMGLADKRALLSAKKRIKEAQSEGKKLTVARACVELDILTEQQAKKVQHKLQRLKEGFASSEEFQGADALPKEKKRTRRRSKEGKVEPSGTGEDEARAKRKKKGEDEAEARQDEAQDDAKAKRRKKRSETGAVEEDEPQTKDEADDEAKDDAKARRKKKPSAEDEEQPKAKRKPSTDEAEQPKAKRKPSTDEAEQPKGKKKPAGDGEAEEPEAEAEEDRRAKKKRKPSEDASAKPAKGKKAAEPSEDELEVVSESAPAKAAEPASDADSDAPAAEAGSDAASDAPASAAGSDADSASDPAPASDSTPAESEEELAAKKKAPPKKGADKKGDKKEPKLGKQIELDSQRAEKQEATKPARGRARNRGMGGAGASDLQERKTSPAPFLALAGAIVVLLVIAIAVAMRGDGKQVAKKTGDAPQESPSASATEVPGPSPSAEPSPGPTKKPDAGAKDRSAWTPKEKQAEGRREAERLVMAADELLSGGKVDEAVAKLKEYPSDLEDQPAFADVKRLRERCERVGPERKRLGAALAAVKAGGDRKEFEQVVLSVLHEKYAFAGEPFLDTFRDEARELLGEEAFDQLVAKAELAALARDTEKEDPEQHKVAFGADLEVELRGTPERHQAFAAQLATFKGNLEAAERRLAEKIAARQRLLREQGERAKKRAGNLKTDDGKSCKLLELTDKGFVIELSGQRHEFGWGSCPPKLGHAVKTAASDPQNAEELYELGMYALKRALFDEARRDFEAAGKAGSKQKVPDIDALRAFVALFRGKHDWRDGKSGETTVAWDFGDAAQEKDFETLHQAMKRTIGGGKLTIQTPQGFLLTAAKAQGAWKDEATIEAQVSSTSPAPAIWFETESGQYLVDFGSKTVLYPSAIAKGGPLASSDVKAGQGDKIAVSVRQRGDKLEVTVSVAGKECFKQEVPGEGEVSFMVGCKGFGRIELGPVTVKGNLSEKWARRTLASAPTRLARELADFEAKLQAGKEAQQLVVPEVFKPTSAEDEVALEGVPDGQRQALNEARALFAQGNEYGAIEKLKEACKNPLFHAANFAYAALMVRGDPTGSMIRFDRACKGVQDFYEAQVGRASALFWLSRYDEAGKQVEDALKLRPDYAPAYLVKANLLVNKGDYDAALRTLELCEELAPGDPFTVATKGRVVALAEGPRWFARATATKKHYALHTDMIQYADKFATQLESIRARYEEAFPLLAVKGEVAQASVLIFSEAEGYYQYSDRTGVGRAENTLGHFNPWSGQLLLFLEEDPDDWNSFHVIFHEGMHQWCHASGMELPFWANEGMAEYVGGTRLNKEGSKIEERGAIDSFLKKRLMNLTSNWNERHDFFDIAKQSPQEFYQGNAPLKYAQAWTMIHFFMEAGDPKLKEAFFKYLEAYKALKTPEEKKSAQEGSKMEYIWNDTLGQLDAVETKKRWEKWVEKLAQKAGLKWKLPN